MVAVYHMQVKDRLTTCSQVGLCSANSALRDTQTPSHPHTLTHRLSFQSSLDSPRGVRSVRNSSPRQQ